MDTIHAKFMKLALKEAAKARQKDEVPIGALIAAESGKILSSAHNQVISLADPTAHAEILAIREAAKKIQNYRLLKTTLYVTIESCIMCMGAIIHARISRVVFGANDPKWGASGSLYNFANDIRLNHQPEIIGGVCEDECGNIIQDFFRTKRIKIPLTPFRKGGMVESPPLGKGDLGGFLPTVVNYTLSRVGG